MAGMTNDYNESCGGIEEAVFRLETTQTFNVTVTVDPLSSWGASAGTSYFIFPARFTGAIGNYTLTVQ